MTLTRSRDTQLNAQTSENELMTAMHSQIRWLSFGDEANPFERYHPLRPIMRWWHDRKMRRYVASLIDRSFESKMRGQTGASQSESRKTIVDLAVDSYRTETTKTSRETLDSTFRDYAMSQIRAFVFAGHDSTSSAVCYTFHMLSENSTARQRLIEEHDQVTGSDVDLVATKLSANPHLLNQLPYTLAVIKESLRLYPPASTTRNGEPHYHVTDDKGRQLPTDGYLVWANTYAIHRSADLWPEPNRFCPERWLVEEGDPLYPRKGAFRPFEHGPRNCIGQELAILEMKLILVMTVREFEVQTVYDEWDRLHPTKAPKTLDGDRAYQILSGAAHPCDGLPSRVNLARH
jgi:cytochrome P450